MVTRLLLRAILTIILATLALLVPPAAAQDAPKDSNVAVPMRDGVVLRAEVWRPRAEGRFPTLVYRTPYGRLRALEGHTTFRRAIERGYAVVIQDVRGRYGSDGEFVAYQQEGRDGYDTIEWAARQPWSDGTVGTFGLSYPGAVQWLAALERPPHLRAMVPAMTYSTPRNFFYFGGVFDLSWIGWIWNNIAPDVRARKDLPGPKTTREARAAWARVGDQFHSRLPLDALDELKAVAPWYFEWLAHPPEDPWWDWAEVRGRYDRMDDIAVLNVSSWYDEAYGPEGATTNFNGLRAARTGQANPMTKVIIGPWSHGVPGPSDCKVGRRDFCPSAIIDYDAMVLDWMDRYVRGIDNGVDRQKAVRYFVMGPDEWREADRWPLPDAEARTMYLGAPAVPGRPGSLETEAPVAEASASTFVSDPASPVLDAHPFYAGANDYRSLTSRKDVLVFDSAPLERDTEVTGSIAAEIHLSSDAPDTDLWVRLLDVAPDGTALNLMSAGLDVLRASYRNGRRELLEPGHVYRLALDRLMTSHVFRADHRIRVQISATFFPAFSRNLHTGARETSSADTRRATITIHHDRHHASRVVLPIAGSR